MKDFMRFFIPKNNHDKMIMTRLEGHLVEALQYFDESRIVGIFLQGSQNYGLDIDSSDVDSKLIVTPTFEEIAFNKKPHSTTYIRENEEHIDFKDIRLMLQTFKKQNVNFIEVLFTPYCFINSKYAQEWFRLIKAKEQIAHYSPVAAVKTMKGVAMEKFHAMEHEYPSKMEVLAKYGYDPKQLHHLLRIQDFLHRYIDGESYQNCLRPREPAFLKKVKTGLFSLDGARAKALAAIEDIQATAEKFYAGNEPTIDLTAESLLDDVQLNIMRIAIKEEM